MPLNRDRNGGGTNADGSRSETYCSLCYVDGQFTQPDLDARQMQDFCVAKLKEQGMPGTMAWLFTRQIPSLGRWKRT